MHLWPSLRIRDSFKQAYLDKIERNLHRMQQHKQRLRGERSSDPLLANSSSVDRQQHETLSPLRSKILGALRFCSDILFVLSCCCCCFCCGGPPCITVEARVNWTNPNPNPPSPV
ncbi:hypothetical protein C4D60_Mb05t03540 [Musa balbisiana]|uniref:Uncharacterized protein n=1 Tax=Musa balbisiana TaxID=52838 RepID=A0A4S8JTF8_MUSBA|nr:hypothetical protein C4D60_Mb05t03540 [Musa balbisiana]